MRELNIREEIILNLENKGFQGKLKKKYDCRWSKES